MKQITWHEPKAFRKTGLKAGRKSVIRIIVLTAILAIIFIGIASWFGLEAGMTWKLLIAACGIVMLCLLLLAASHLVPNRVKITEKAVVISDYSETATVYRLKSIDHCEVGTMLMGSRMYPVLVIEFKNGDREIIGVDPAVSKESLQLALEQMGVTVMIRPDMMSEGALEDEKRDPRSNTAGFRKDRG